VGANSKSAMCPVNTWNEWDPLEEVIVGTAWGALHPVMSDPVNDEGALNPGLGGQPFPLEVLYRVQTQLDRFVGVLVAEGVTVRRPSPFDLACEVVTPFFSVPCGFNFMNARDLVLIVGDEIIEAPTAARTRYFETLAMRTLFKEYFKQGAKWTSALKPQLGPDSFNSREVRTRIGLKQEMTSEYEPLFDAADFVRCGRDIFCQRGARTNRFGIEWLSRHLGERFCIHEIQTRCEFSVHIDTTFVPLGPRRVLVNPHWIGVLPEIVKGWEVVVAPDPEGRVELFSGINYQTSPFIAMNVFLLDERRVFVDYQQKKLIKLLQSLGMETLDIPFDLPPFLGGAFHCVTLDVRRRGSLQSYRLDTE
jgi:glycine amidinotransferase